MWWEKLGVNSKDEMSRDRIVRGMVANGNRKDYFESPKSPMDIL